MSRGVLTAMLLGLAGAARAADAPPSDADLARAAAGRDPRVLAARAEAAQLRAESRGDLRFPDPQLRGEYGRLEPFPETVFPGELPSAEDALRPDDPDRKSWRAGLRVNLPNLWTWRAESAAARARFAAADATVDVELRAAGRPVREAALAAAWRARRVLNARAQVRAEDAVCATVQERVQAGRGTVDETVRARLELVSSRGALQSLEQDFQAAIRDVRAATGLALEADPALWAERAGPPAGSDEPLEAAQDRALAARPERRLCEARRRAADADGLVARRSVWPSPAYVEGGWRHDEEWDAREGWSVDLAINLPIFSAMTPGVRRLRALERDAANEALSAAETAILDDVRAAWEADRAARAAWQAFETEREALRGDVERLRSTVAEGSGDAVALERVERGWRALDDRLLRLQEAAAAARLRLDFATGTAP